MNYKKETLIKKAHECVDMMVKYEDDFPMFKKTVMALSFYIGQYCTKINTKHGKHGEITKEVQEKSGKKAEKLREKEKG